MSIGVGVPISGVTRVRVRNFRCRIVATSGMEHNGEHASRGDSSGDGNTGTAAGVASVEPVSPIVVAIPLATASLNMYKERKNKTKEEKEEKMRCKLRVVLVMIVV